MEVLTSQTELSGDPWQSAFDALFEEKFSPEALELQAQQVTSLRQEAAQFLSIAENFLGLQAAQQYAMQMCNHPHLVESANSYLQNKEHEISDGSENLSEHIRNHNHKDEEQEAKQDKSDTKRKPATRRQFRLPKAFMQRFFPKHKAA